MTEKILEKGEMMKALIIEFLEQNWQQFVNFCMDFGMSSEEDVSTAFEDWKDGKG